MTISTQADQKTLENAIKEISASLTRIEAERDLIKAVLTTVSDNLQIEKKLVRKLAKVYHKSTFTQESELNQEFETLYTTVFHPEV
jgi:hypothetical protein